MTPVAWLLCFVLACGWVYWGVAVIAAERWRKIPRTSRQYLPGVSILKPLCGTDPDLLENLASFCSQNYPRYEVLFVAEDADDPALEIAREVVQRHPYCTTRILSGSPPIGANRKVRNLAHAMQFARHDIIVISDSDMRVAPNYLARIGAHFAEPDTGVVTCLYRSWRPQGLASRLEALSIGAEFVPGVLVAWLFAGPHFGFGSTIAIRRDVLERFGGFSALADELADDFRLCEKARGTGARQVLSDYVVDYVPGRQSLAAVWARRVRWARTIRVLRPWGALASIVTHILVLSVVLAVVHRSALTLSLVLASSLWRTACAVWIARRATEDSSVQQFPWLLPLSDMLSLGVWLASLNTRRVRWRSLDMLVGRGGLLLERRSGPARAGNASTGTKKGSS